ncbi:pre-mRNA-splicing factor syf1 [Tieghemiomyces parasiticus]|uniref:Pre-mRNA-splicing factor SYF1 n=1 Tax=Tieghemiomyces parasiticus TaxID=78921 RepID=A0A9W8DU87_9FUNG|nr:pre-mRNA-splicing factor syf1 [Tieghemiomyces parasiticus]
MPTDFQADRVALDAVLNFASVEVPDEDLAFEQDVQQNPYNLRCWWRYLDHKATAPPAHRVFLFERAVQDLPGSYKLWKAYLDLRTSLLRGRNPVVYAEHYRRANFCFERALILLHKMPRIWLDYTQFLAKQPRVTLARRTFDRALRALPVTQHDRVWPAYAKFARRIGGETALRAYRRYVKLEPSATEDYIDLLLELGRYDAAAVQLVTLIDNSQFVSRRGRTRYELWTQLCDLMCEQPQDIQSVRADLIIKSGISRFTDQAGRLWNALAQYWILLGQFEKARDVYEDGVRSVMTVRDFTQVFDAYAEFQESLIASRIRAAADRAPTADDQQPSDLALDLQLARFEDLMDRRPFLVNDVLLRQNPHNVLEWENRAQLWADLDRPDRVVATYTEAAAAVHPKKAVGKFHQLWIRFARYLEDRGDLPGARAVFEKAVRVDYKHVNDLAEVWCAYGEMEVRHRNFAAARALLGRATAPPPQWQKVNFHDESLPVLQRVFKSLRLWSFYADLEESTGTLDATRAVYDQIIHLRIATPQIIVNYAALLRERQYFEESFKVYERGIDQFGYPVAFELWNLYLTAFVARYGGTKLERTRDLFEQAVTGCPPEYAKPLYLLYGRLEEDHGSARHAMRIYDRATRAVGDADRLAMYEYYIARTTALFGIVATREIYERALETLPDALVRDLGRHYAAVELQLGEIDRARALFAYTAQFCDPRVTQGKSGGSLWAAWHDFEVKHGNEDTFKEMLRIKRSVQTKFNTEASFVAAKISAAQQAKAAQPNGAAALSAAASAQPFMAATSSAPGGAEPKSGGDTMAAVPNNPNELTIDTDDEDD